MESSQFTQLKDAYYDDPEQLSQLLRQRAGTEHSTSLLFTTSTELTSGEAATSAEYGAPPQPQQQPLVTQPVSTRDFAPPSRRVARETRNVPSLSKFNSAPNSSGFVMERAGAERLYQSFGEPMLGDTQPDSQIYKQWTSGVFGNVADDNDGNGLGNIALLSAVQEQDVDTTTDGAEMAGSSQEQQSPTVTSPTVIQEDDTETQLRSNIPLTSPLKFETPAMAGRKRDNQGEILSSAMRTATTPGTALTMGPFFPGGFGSGGTGNGMSLTQLFNATQAGTSPLVHDASEDAIFQRPSPNFTVARNSSPPPVGSSPIKVTNSDPVLRSSSEPRAEYVTMKQSQERRLREVEDEDAKPAVQDSWDEPTETQKQRERRRAKARSAQEAAKTFATVSAPSLSSPAPRRRAKRTLLSISKTPKFKTPASSRVAARSAYEGPFDDIYPDREESGLTGSLLAKQNVEHDDSPDELSQGIPSSARPTPVKAMIMSETKVQVPRTSSHPQRTLSGQSPRNSPPVSPSAQLRQRSQRRSSSSQMRTRASQSKGSTPPVTIMDSQPDAIVEASSSVPRSKSLLVHSSPSTNQYSINQTILVGKTGFGSQMTSSSMPPMSPSSSPQLGADTDGNKDEHDVDEHDEDRVPSSPPPLGADDIVYDEHHYDEHHSAAEDEGDVVEQPVDEDAGMAGVPESEHASDEEVNEPQKTDNQGDHKRQENDGQEQLSDVADVDEPICASQENNEDDSTHDIAEKPRMQRQSTVPESDLMDDTQPSIFAEFAQSALHGNDQDQVVDSAVDDSVVLNQTLSTEPFHTAREQQTISQSNNGSNEASKNGKASMIDDGPRYRSLNDIANQPETQTTAEDITAIDLPRLSFTEDIEHDLMSGSSPIRPGKKRKITYNSKRKSMKPPHDSDSVALQLPLSPLRPSLGAPEASPSSTMEREEQGALAAANAREAVATKPAILKSAALARSTRSSSGRKGALKPVKKELLKKSSPKKPNTRDVTSVEGALSFPASIEAQNTDVEMTDAGAPQTKEDGDDNSTPVPNDNEAINSEIGQEINCDNPPLGEVTFPNRVFALWPGGGQSYYPATFAGFLDNAQTKCNILFDSLDGDDDDAQRNSTTLDHLHVRALDLRLGDVVKVNEKGLKSNHLIVGFKDRIDPDGLDGFVSTDRLGYQTVVLESQKRDNTTKDQSVIERPVEMIYLTSNLWRHFSDRAFGTWTTFSSGGPDSRVGTPAEDSLGPSTKRGTAGLSLLNPRVRAGSVTSTRSGTGTIFRDMAFAITLVQDNDEAERNAITQRIQSNGGMILDDGFHTQFESADIEEEPSSSAMKGKAKAKSKDKDISCNAQLKLKDEYKHTQLVALITDSHSRRTKHIQALALNVPCLHHRWLTDSIQASKALPFERYILPAGISDYLGGAIRSRTLTLHEPTERFEEVIKHRNRLLQGQSVLLVTGSTKQQLDRKKPYAFLTQALGASLMSQCVDLTAAKTLLKKQHFDWIYVSQEDSVTEASRALFDDNATTGRKPIEGKAGRRKSASNKRKRDQSEDGEPLVQVGTANGNKVKVASDEFLVQSLILGELLPHGNA